MKKWYLGRVDTEFRKKLTKRENSKVFLFAQYFLMLEYCKYMIVVLFKILQDK